MLIRCILFLFLATCTFGQAQTVKPTTPASAPQGRRRDVQVSAPDNSTKLVMLRWARRLRGKFETRTGLSCEFNNQEIWIRVHDDGGEPDAGCGQKYTFGRVRQHVGIRHVDRIEREVSDAALCEAFLMGHLNRQWAVLSPSVPFREWVETRVPAQVPAWFCRGFARGLHATIRAEDGQRVAEAWREEQLPTLDEFFEFVKNEKRNSLSEARMLEAMGTEICEWILSVPDPAPRFQSLVTHLSQDKTLNASWIASIMPGCETAADAEAEWALWLGGSDLRIVSPGKTAASDLAQLTALMTDMNTGDFDADLFGDPPPRHVKDLIPLRQHSAISGFVATRTDQLRLLALGRSKDFAQAVEMYLHFLAALVEGQGDAALRELYSRALKESDKLTQQMDKDTRADQR